MSTKIDRNFRSYSGEDGAWGTDVLGPITLNPTAEHGWPRGSWSDTLKLHKCHKWLFSYFTVHGGAEDCVDLANQCSQNNLAEFTVFPDGMYVLTVKGGSKLNSFAHWRVIGTPSVCDIEIGNWAHVDQGSPTGNSFADWITDTGRPVTYCYRFGCKPKFTATKTKHLWWRSIGITVYFYAKLALFKLSKGKLT